MLHDLESRKIKSSSLEISDYLYVLIHSKAKIIWLNQHQILLNGHKQFRKKQKQKQKQHES